MDFIQKLKNKQRLTEMPEYKALQHHFLEMKDQHIKMLFKEDPERIHQFSLQLDDILFDYSKNIITQKTMDLLIQLAKASGIEDARKAMFSGEKINWTENREVLHIALRNRSQTPIIIDKMDVMPEVNSVLDQMKQFSQRIRTGEWKGFTGKPIRSIVHIGIGGSYLGPLMITEALKSFSKRDLLIRFVANIDGTDFYENTWDLNPEETLFIIASKTFTTQETLANAYAARSWCLKALKDDSAIKSHFVAISTNQAGVESFGIDPQNMFRFWDWVGGRYSWASSIGLPIMCSIGYDHYVELLEGAHFMDLHFRDMPLSKNAPVILALLGIWYNHFFGAETQAILPYAQYLKYLPMYLQQADMESNGKYVDCNGDRVSYPTGTVIWGETGTNGQHAFFQLIHQGTRIIPADFIGCIIPNYAVETHHSKLLAHFIAQTEALMKGNTKNDVETGLKNKGMDDSTIKMLLPHKSFDGNKPTNTILLNQLTPKTLGALIALYEMKIFVQGIIWRINSFDQWGVELGKVLSNVILKESEQIQSGKMIDLSHHDASTAALIQKVNNK